jgi:hypothetical protein
MMLRMPMKRSEETKIMNWLLILTAGTFRPKKQTIARREYALNMEHCSA